MSDKVDFKKAAEELKKFQENLVLEEAKSLTKSMPKPEDKKENSQGFGYEERLPNWQIEANKESEKTMGHLAADRAHEQAISKSAYDMKKASFKEAQAVEQTHLPVAVRSKKGAEMTEHRKDTKEPSLMGMKVGRGDKVAALHEAKAGVERMKASSKPNLPKSAYDMKKDEFMGKAKQDEGKSDKDKIRDRTERGTHLFPESHLAGVHSPRMGRNKTTTIAASKAALAQQRNMPKPNLPKSELQKDDPSQAPKTDMSAWSKMAQPASTQNANWSNNATENYARAAQGATGQASAPAPMPKSAYDMKKNEFIGKAQAPAKPIAPKVNVPPKGSMINVKGPIKPESINKLKDAGYGVTMKAENGNHPDTPTAPRPKMTSSQGAPNVKQSNVGIKPPTTRMSMGTRGASISTSVQGGMGGSFGKANPDEKQDAKLGEDVEHVVEDHLIANKDAEKKEGDPIMSRYEIGKAAFHKRMADQSNPNLPKSAYDMKKDEWASKRVKSHQNSRNVSGVESAKGVHGSHWAGKPGESTAGMQIRTKADMMTDPKEKHARKLEELKEMPKPNLPKSEMQKSEYLGKPYTSRAQQKWAHTEAGKKALGGESHVHEWDEASKGKKLPEHVKKEEKGVHKPAFMHSKKSGTSEVGARMAPGGSHPKTNTWAKEEHKKVLADLKSMPKPNLPKSEIEKGEIQAKPQSKLYIGGAGGGSHRYSSWKTAGNTVPRIKGPGAAVDEMRTVDMQTGKYKMHGPEKPLPKSEIEKGEHQPHPGPSKPKWLEPKAGHEDKRPAYDWKKDHDKKHPSDPNDLLEAITGLKNPRNSEAYKKAKAGKK